MPYRTEIIVRGYHLDGYGHVNNARYLEFLEEARWAACDGKEDTLTWFMQRNFALTVQRIEIDYKRAATMGDVLVVDTQIVARHSKSYTLKQIIRRRTGQKVIAEAQVFLCVVSVNQGGALTLEAEIGEKLEALLG